MAKNGTVRSVNIPQTTVTQIAPSFGGFELPVSGGMPLKRSSFFESSKTIFCTSGCAARSGVSKGNPSFAP